MSNGMIAALVCVFSGAFVCILATSARQRKR